ncbi:uncharacterized protein LOC122507624 [Leptopilina heterotoma]|uniref:uncharacterized protein LOC122507624 n=1 Tax=Leptopilina heterotoma TaxID=63436 RepID=UPI001CA827ED|nr:uncharacterized protein LOC122507624 [Leptopilina heterotoma]
MRPHLSLGKRGTLKGVKKRQQRSECAIYAWIYTVREGKKCAEEEVKEEEDTREKERERERERYNIFLDGIFNALARSVTRSTGPTDWTAWILCHEFTSSHWLKRALDLSKTKPRAQARRSALWRALQACVFSSVIRDDTRS